MIGKSIGPYQILAELGRGGMGEVYRARDTKLDRDVALKILPESFASDPDRLMRFEREAKTLASINHPNIAAIYGIEDRALVMELVEGPDLSEVIRSSEAGASSGIPFSDALPIARQIIEALEAAHEAGIIHRDLKPANIKVRADGTVKVLDFGLAKAMAPAAGDRTFRSGSNAGSMDPASDKQRNHGPWTPDPGPTMTSPAMTAMGMVLGTAAYMSPEQAKGRPVDKRADIWAFGAVFYEMLSGQQAFQGEDVSDLLVAVLSKDVDLGALPANTPPSITTLLRRCLERDPRARLRDIGDARHMLDQAKTEMLGGRAIIGDQPAPPTRRAGALTLALAGVALVSLAIAAWSLSSRGSLTRPTYLSIALPAGHALISGPAISPDGEVVAFVSSDGIARPQLYVRRLDEPNSRLIDGTEDANGPFFSPDSRSVAFYGKNALFKVSLDGGAPFRLADSGSHFGGTWLDDGRIVFSRSWNGGFYTVPENGGQAELLVEPKRPQEYAYVWPVAVPGRRELLFAQWGDSFTIQRLDLQTKTLTKVTDAWRKFAYATAGYLVLGTDVNELWAVPYKGGTAGSSTTVAERVDGGDMGGDARFDVSTAGTLAYSAMDRRKRSLVTVDLLGRHVATTSDARAYSEVELSPDNQRVLTIDSGVARITDLSRGTSTPLVPELTKGAREALLWTPDGRVVFASNHEGNWEIYSKAATGIGTLEPVLRRPLDQFPLSLAPDGALLFAETHGRTGADIWILPKSGEPVPWLVTSGEEGEARFSPNGQLVAYESNSSGRSEVYVQARVSGGSRVQLSVAGGTNPAWSPTGDRVYFRQNNAMMMATIDAGNDARGGLSAGPAQQLFEGGWALPGERDFHVRPDGRSFLMILNGPEAIPTRIDLVLNWFTVLAAKMSGR